MEPERRGFRNLAAKLSRLVEKTSTKHSSTGSTSTAVHEPVELEQELPSAADCAKFDDLELDVITKLYAELLKRSRQPEDTDSAKIAQGIDKATFVEYFQLPGLWADGLFKMFTTDRVVKFANFVHGLSICCRGTKTERVGILFRLFDMNNDGAVSKDELTAMLSNVPLLDNYMQPSKTAAALSRTHSKTTVLTDVRKTDDSASSGREMSSLGWAFEEEVDPIGAPINSSQSSAAFNDSDGEPSTNGDVNVEPSPMVTEMLARVRRDDALESESNDLEALVSSILEQYDACGSESLDLDSFRLFVDHHPAILKLFSDCLREDVWSLKGHALGRAVHKRAHQTARQSCQNLEQWINVRKQFIKLAPKQVQAPGTSISDQTTTSDILKNPLPPPPPPLPSSRLPLGLEKGSTTGLTNSNLPSTTSVPPPNNLPLGTTTGNDFDTDVSYFLGLGTPQSDGAAAIAAPTAAAAAAAVPEHLLSRGKHPIELNCPSCLAPLVVCPSCGGRYTELKIQHDDVYVVCRVCSRKSHECWICNYNFHDTLNASLSEFQMQGDLYNSDGVKLHFLLADRMLYYFEKDGDKVPSGFIFLEGWYVEPIGEQSLDLGAGGGSKVRLIKRNANPDPTTADGGVSGAGGVSGHHHQTEDGAGGVITGGESSELTIGEGGVLHRGKQRSKASSSSAPSPEYAKFGFCIIPSKVSEKRKTLYAPDANSLKEWLEALRSELSQRPIHDLYDMHETIGQGKFSVVYRAIERDTQEVVAIKVVHKSRMNAEAKELLRSEIGIMRMLRHPHVIYLKRIVSSREALYIVMEHVPGGELFKVISRQQAIRANNPSANNQPLLKELAVHRLAVQLLKTLEYLHKSGIVHRDLKPENILLTDSNEIEHADVKIADFGLSCLCGPKEVLKLPCGTLVYAAPEVLTMKGYNHKVDIWSVGVVVYLLLCGKLPFPALRNMQSLNDLDTFFTVKYDAPAWTFVSPTCKDFLSKLLVVDPQVRFSSQQALAHIWIKNPAAVIGE